MGSTGNRSPDPTPAGGSACLVQSTSPPWHLTSTVVFSERHPRVPTPSPRTPPWAGTGMHVLNRGGKGVRNPVDAL